MSVCHDFFLDDNGCAGAELCAGNALCGIDTLQLNGIHFNICVFLCFYMCLGVDDALAAAVPLTDVLFDINNLGIFAKEETVNPFMDGIVTATVMDAAAGDNFNFRTLTDVEIIINHLRHTILCNQRRDVYVFIFGKGLYINIQTGAALLGDNINIFCGMSALALAVVADVKCSICRDFRNAGNLL